MAARKEKQQPSKLKVELPKGYKIVKGDNFAKSFFFEKVGDSIEGVVLSVKEITYQKKKRLIMAIETKKGVYSVWDSAALIPLFEQAKPKDEVYIRYDGLAEKHKKGQNPMKHFTTGIK